MKVAVVSPFPPFRGGIAQFSETLCKAIVYAGHDCRGFSFSRQYPQLLFPGTQQYEDGQVSDVVHSASIDSIQPASWIRIAHNIANWNPDAVIFPFWTAFLAPCFTTMAFVIKRNSANTRVIGLFHNANSHDARWFEKCLTKRLLRKLDEAWTLSRDVSERLIAYGYNRPITTAFHPLYEHFEPLVNRSVAKSSLGIPDDGKMILFFGLIRPYKGLDVLIQAANSLLLAGQDFRVCIAGEPYEDWRKYQEAINSGGNADRFHTHLHFIPQKDVHVFFSAADLICLPYKAASQSGVTAIAMHYHKPVLASNVGGLQEYFGENPLGFLCPPNDANALANGILEALHASPPRSNEIDKWNQRFSWDAFVAHCLHSEPA